MSYERPEAKKILDKNQAFAQIAEIEARVMLLGANDSEHAEFENIRKALESGRLTSEEAVEMAQAIWNRKQAYH